MNPSGCDIEYHHTHHHTQRFKYHGLQPQPSQSKSGVIGAVSTSSSTWSWEDIVDQHVDVIYLSLSHHYKRTLMLSTVSKRMRSVVLLPHRTWHNILWLTHSILCELRKNSLFRLLRQQSKNSDSIVRVQSIAFFVERVWIFFNSLS